MNNAVRFMALFCGRSSPLVLYATSKPATTMACFVGGSRRRLGDPPEKREVNTYDQADRTVRLIYTIGRTQKHLDDPVGFQTTRPNLGGVRWCFTCPLIKNVRPADGVFRSCILGVNTSAAGTAMSSAISPGTRMQPP